VAQDSIDLWDGQSGSHLATEKRFPSVVIRRLVPFGTYHSTVLTSSVLKATMGSSAKPRRLPMKATEEEPARTRMLSAAFAAFTEHGFARASTLEIATRAGVSKRELYALFGNKQQMLITCISERGQRMQLPADWPVAQSGQDLEANLAKFGSVLLQEVTDSDVIAVYRLAVSEADRSPEVAQALDSYGQQASRSALKEILQSAQSAGLLIRTDPDRMVSRFMALLLENLVMSLALGLAKRPGPKEMRRRALEATEAFLRLYSENEPQTGATRPPKRQTGTMPG
jgi:AcrR family transcriptional regulator